MTTKAIWSAVVVVGLGIAAGCDDKSGRTTGPDRPADTATPASARQSASDTARSTGDAARSTGQSARDTANNTGTAVRNGAQDAGDATMDTGAKVKERLSNMGTQTKEGLSDAKDKVTDWGSDAKDKTSDTMSSARDKTADTAASARDKTYDASHDAQKAGSNVAGQSSEWAQKQLDQVQQLIQQGKHDDARQWLSKLEPHKSSLPQSMQNRIDSLKQQVNNQSGQQGGQIQ